MGHYTPPIRDMQFVLHELLEVEKHYAPMPAHSEVSRELIDQVLEEGGKFCSQVLFPLNRSADEEGCTLSGDGVVTTPKGFREAWKQFVAGQWPSLSCDPAFGGQGLPHTVQTAFQEMMNASCQAFTMYPGLTHGAYQCLVRHGSPEQQRLYLPRLVSGEWTGTMCLTEAHCGTDLGLLRSRAVAQADGSYSISGSKIFISSGEHDLSENIVHLVLARLPDAPPGSRGISLFIVPKFLPDGEGKPGARNAVKASRIEEKMGIHANSTCQMEFDGATGWMVGEANRGLVAMFVMMNGARLGVGLQSLGLMDAAYQQSAAYARDRTQGRALTGAKAPDKPADPIIVHPDVRRMLLTQRAWTEGCRALAYWIAFMIDRYEHDPDEEVRKECTDLVALLTPIVKAFTTDNGFQSTVLAQQVFGGHGYIRESGMEQYVRDARINMIYEGTNTIQSLDLLGRKVLGDNGAKLRKLGALIAALVEEEGTNEAMAEFINPLADLAGRIEKLTTEIGMKALQNPDEAGAAAVDYLRVIGHLVLSYLWARMAKVALAKADEPFYAAKLTVARFYFAKLQPETSSLMRTVRSGAASLMELEAELF
ncbi:MAG: acyl-CoA dehydrogenase C-terminal domain-containing protein [Burkholderiaceae bacterium]|nr:acyl-CoA dehydrogenase C-terminal domain-containing protein [Burkholderiaceae bacterium]